MAKQKRVLCYVIERREVYSRFRLEIRVFFAYEEFVKRKFEGTVDNKDGYQTLEAAKRMGDWYRLLLESGHKHVFDWTQYAGASVTMAWSEVAAYTSGDFYSGPHYADGEVQEPLVHKEFEPTVAGIELLKRIGRSIEKIKFSREMNVHGREKPDKPSNHTFLSPTLFIAGLEALRARRVMRFENRSHSNWVHDTSRRIWLMSDTLTESLEME